MKITKRLFLLTLFLFFKVTYSNEIHIGNKVTFVESKKELVIPVVNKSDKDVEVILDLVDLTETDWVRFIKETPDYIKKEISGRKLKVLANSSTSISIDLSDPKKLKSSFGYMVGVKEIIGLKGYTVFGGTYMHSVPEVAKDNILISPKILNKKTTTRIKVSFKNDGDRLYYNYLTKVFLTDDKGSMIARSSSYRDFAFLKPRDVEEETLNIPRIADGKYNITVIVNSNSRVQPKPFTIPLEIQNGKLFGKYLKIEKKVSAPPKKTTKKKKEKITSPIMEKIEKLKKSKR